MIESFQAGSLMSLLFVLITMYLTTFGTWNIRGLDNSLDTLNQKLDHFDVMFICETWLEECSESKLSQINKCFWYINKHSKSVSTGHRASEGVLMLVRKHTNYKMSVIDIGGYERSHCVRLKSCDTEVYIIGAHLPSSNVLDSTYLDALDSVMEMYDICSQTGQTILMGYFNTDLRTHIVPVKKRAASLHRALTERQLYSVVPVDDATQYTFSTKDGLTRTLIDYVFFSKDDLYCVTGYLIDTNVPYSVSDHLPLMMFIDIKGSCKRYDGQKLNWRKASDIDPMLYRYESEEHLRETSVAMSAYSSPTEYINAYNDMIVGDCKYDTPEEMCSAFSSHFRTLATPETSENFDEQFASSVLDKVVNIEKSYSGITSDTEKSALEKPFTPDEVWSVVRALKSGKSPGPDCLTNEHVKRAGCSLFKHITVLFNAIVKYECIPTSYYVGKILPIHKGHGKSKSNVNHYRGITLTSVLSKLFERLLLCRIENCLTDKYQFPHHLQFGFRRNAGAETACLCLSENIAYYNERLSTVYCDLSR